MKATPQNKFVMARFQSSKAFKRSDVIAYLTSKWISLASVILLQVAIPQKNPSSITYLNVISRDSVCLAFLITALNGIDILSCDLENAYLNAQCREKIWFEGGLECGEDVGKVCIVMCALYSLKSVGTSW